MAPRKDLSNIQLEFSGCVTNTEERLTTILRNHLNTASLKLQSELHNNLREMDSSTNIATTAELMNHHRFQSATERNVEKESRWRCHLASRKLQGLHREKLRFAKGPSDPYINMQLRSIAQVPMIGIKDLTHLTAEHPSRPDHPAGHPSTSIQAPSQQPPPPPADKGPTTIRAQTTADQTSGLGTASSTELELYILNPSHNPIPTTPIPPPVPHPLPPLLSSTTIQVPSILHVPHPNPPTHPLPPITLSPVSNAAPLSPSTVAGLTIANNLITATDGEVMAVLDTPPRIASASPPPPPEPIASTSNPTPTVSFYTPVLNLSKKKILTDDQTRALELGLKFAPTPLAVPSPLEFFQNYKIRCAWAYKRITGHTSNQMPIPIQTRLDIMEDDLEDLQNFDSDSNIPRNIRAATLELKRDKSLTIRQADKGSCLVVMDTEQYISEGMEHLQDAKTYKRVDHDKTAEVAHKANWICRHYSTTSILTKNKSSRLSNNIPEIRTQQMYFLKKIHKNPYKLRPIVSCSSGPTEKLSGHLCAVLSTHLDDIPNLIRNSQDAIARLANIDLSREKDVILVSLDVVNLYMSIPQGAGIEEVLQRVVHTCPATSRISEFKNFLRDSLKVVVKDNHFQFSDCYFDQVRGIAMGTKCAPPFANLYLASLEERALKEWKGTDPLAWMRFLDDVLMLWTGGVEQLSQFLDHLNSQVSSIKYTMEYSQDKTTFLDLDIYKGPRFQETGRLDTKLHIKATNSQSYLHYTSNHPRYIFKNIVRGEVLRALRATSDRDIFLGVVQDMQRKFLARGYPSDLIHRVADGIKFEERQYHLATKLQQEPPVERVYFSVPHHPGLDYSSIRKIITDKETPFAPMMVRRRSQNHGDVLTRARTHEVPQRPRKD